jgi:hypothetical protein
MRTHDFRTMNTRAYLLIGAFLALAGCDDVSGSGGAGSTSSSTGMSISTSTSSTSTTSSATSSVSSTSSGGMSDTPVLAMTKVGNPLWEPADFHQFSAPVGMMFKDFSTVTEGILPPPNHVHHDQLGVGPGAAHAGPYTGEIAAGVTAKGYVDHTTFPKVDGTLPNAIVGPWMMIPSAGAPMGASPDGAMTPIIPNPVFPIAVSGDTFQNGMKLAGYSYSFNVPALDSSLMPPFNGMDGHSHFPLFNAVFFDGLPTYPGTFESKIHLEDQNGDGWDLVITTIGIN